MQLSTLFFDLDDTLYSSAAGLWDAIKARMSEYMVERLRIPAADVPALRRMYFETYGTTLRGLQKHHQVNSDDFLGYVHDVPVDQYIQPDPALRPILLSLPQRRWILTNADEAHAHRVLGALGLEGVFHGIIDVRALQFACKPELEAYERALRLSGVSSPQTCAFFDDSVRNLAAAHRAGLVTVLVGKEVKSEAYAQWQHTINYTLPGLRDLPAALPGLWNHAPALTARDLQSQED